MLMKPRQEPIVRISKSSHEQGVVVCTRTAVGRSG